MNLRDPEGPGRLLPAELHAYPSPIPTQCVSSDEFMPAPQTPAQRRAAARVEGLAGDLVLEREAETGGGR